MIIYNKVLVFCAYSQSTKQKNRGRISNELCNSLSFTIFNKVKCGEA